MIAPPLKYTIKDIIENKIDVEEFAKKTKLNLSEEGDIIYLSKDYEYFLLNYERDLRNFDSIYVLYSILQEPIENKFLEDPSLRDIIDFFGLKMKSLPDYKGNYAEFVVFNKDNKIYVIKRSLDYVPEKEKIELYRFDSNRYTKVFEKNI